MARFIITGGKKLTGRIKVSGNKNSILPCLAACLLTDQSVTLKNVPNISDVAVTLEILQDLGASVTKQGDQITVKADKLKPQPKLSQEHATQLRASILLVGPLLSRVGKVQFYHPGGDVIGRRSIDTHLDGFRELGYDFESRDTFYNGYKTQDISQNREIFMEDASVTATENLIMGSVLGKTVTVLKNCAEEPHIVDLCNLLVEMGAKIEGIGTSKLTIKGVTSLGGGEYTISGDYMEFGTYAIAACITGGEIEIEKANLPDLDPVTVYLSKMGIIFEDQGEVYRCFTKNIEAISKLKVNIWPGFPTDLMSVAIVLATQAKGVSLMHDWMYESRMFFVDKLIAMGANITICDPHRVLVCGATQLYGRNVETPDIRAGMALVLAALAAEGISTINRAELIERGYEDVVEKLTSLGAEVRREN